MNKYDIFRRHTKNYDQGEMASAPRQTLNCIKLYFFKKEVLTIVPLISSSPLSLSLSLSISPPPLSLSLSLSISLFLSFRPSCLFLSLSLLHSLTRHLQGGVTSLLSSLSLLISSFPSLSLCWYIGPFLLSPSFSSNSIPPVSPDDDRG